MTEALLSTRRDEPGEPDPFKKIQHKAGNDLVTLQGNGEERAIAIGLGPEQTLNGGAAEALSDPTSLEATANTGWSVIDGEFQQCKGNGTEAAELPAIRKYTQLCQALARGARLLSRDRPETAALFRRGIQLITGEIRRRRASALALAIIFFMFTGIVAPFTDVASGSNIINNLNPDNALQGNQLGSPSDFALNTASSNLTIQSAGSIVTVFTEEYKLKVDYRTAFVDYTINPYFTTDFIRYRRVNAAYSGDGTYDQNGVDLSISMTISRFGRVGSTNTVFFVESCAEFSLNQSFTFYRDYFELNVAYAPGIKKVVTTYFIGLYTSTGAAINLLKSGNFCRYVPGFDENTPAGFGIGGWYPSTRFYAPCCDLRNPSGNLGVEWGYNETVAYLYSPLWMNDMGGGGPSTFSLKYSSMNSIVPNPGLGTAHTFHMFVRPYQYSDGKQRGYDVGYAQWVAPKIFSAWGNPHTSVFPLTVMDTGSWTADFRSWVQSSQVKVATYSTNPSQINWNYKSSQIPYIPNVSPDTPAVTPVAWQLYKAAGTPLTAADGSVICNPVNGPYTTTGTYRWHLIQDDPANSWWWGSTGVFWDEMNSIDIYNNPRNDYQNRSQFVYEGYLSLIRESYQSGHWTYVIANGYSAELHLSMAADLSIIEGFCPSSVTSLDFTGHTISTMNFVNNIPAQYRPNLVVYQEYGASNPADQTAVYNVLFNSAKYGFHVELLSYDPDAYQIHNLAMAEAMFKAMGCTRDSDARTTVGTIDTALATTLTTAAPVIVMKGGIAATINSEAMLSQYAITNLHSAQSTFNLVVPTDSYYQSGTDMGESAWMSYTADGKATFHGQVAAEKTGLVTARSDIGVKQLTSGTASVKQTAHSSTGATIQVSATGGSTEITVKSLTVGKTFDVLVNGVKANTLTASDGSIKFTNTYGSSDTVVVQEAISGGDVTPPTVSAASPANAASGVALGSSVSITFSEAMDKASTGAAFRLESHGATVAGSIAWSNGDTVLAFTPSGSLTYGSRCNVSISTSAKDVALNPLSSTYNSFFTTLATDNRTVPGVPQSLNAVGSVGQVSLSWQTPMSDGGAAITSYKVYRAAADGSNRVAIATGITQLSYINSGLAANTTYRYDVSAANVKGEGASTSYVTAKTASVPGVPTNLNIEAANQKAVLSWSAPSSNGGSAIISYDVLRGSSPTNCVVIGTSASNSFEDTGLTNGVTYYYQIRAVNAVGAGASCSAISVIPLGLPSSPRSLALTPSDSAVALSWTAPADNGASPITGYQVWRGTTPTDLVLITIATTLAYQDSGLTNGQTYYYKVFAINGQGSEATGVSGSAVPATVPGSPSNLLTQPSDATITLSWSQPASDGGKAIVAYQVYRRISGGSWAQITQTANRQYTDSGLVNGRTYDYYLTATNAMGAGPASSAVSATPLSLPNAPSSLVATPRSTAVDLAWAAPTSNGGSPIDHYCIYRSEAGSQPTLLTTVAGLSYADEGLVNGRHYVYSVSAVTAAGEGPSSASAEAVPATIPTVPASVSAQAGNGEVLLSWQAPVSDGGGEITGYKVYRSVSGAAFQLLATTGTVLQYRDQGLGNEITYAYEVSALNWVGEGYLSSEVQATTNFSCPTSPRNLTIQAGDGVSQISWSAPTDSGGSALAGYRITRTLGVQQTKIEISAGILTYHDSNLANGETYSYSISAFNQLREGLPCSPISVMPQGEPSVPLNLNGFAEGTKAHLVWSAPASNNGSALIGYEVLYGPNPNSLSHLVNLSASVTSHLTEALQPGSQYCFAIVAINGVGRSPLSSIVSVSIPNVPTAPVDPKAINGGNGITVTWSAPELDGGMPILVYDVHRSVDGGSELSVAMVHATNCSYVDLDVSNGHSYSYSIHALNAVGEGAPSSLVGITLAGSPGQPINIGGTTGEGSATVTWSEPSNDGGSPILSYSVYMSVNGSDPALAGTVSALERSWTQVGLDHEKSYLFFVTATNAKGEGTASGSISLSPLNMEAVDNGTTLALVQSSTNMMDKVPVATLSSSAVIALGLVGSGLVWRRHKISSRKFDDALDTLETMLIDTNP